DPQLKTDLEVILGRASAMLRLARQTPAQAKTPAPAPAASAVSEPAAAPADAAPAPALASTSAESATGGPGASGFSGSAQIEHLLLEAQARMIVSDFANASRVYARLVELAPRVLEYRVRLAVCMAKSPRLAKQAEREFLEAVNLDPDNADLHYKFAMYYKAMKQRARAQAELQTALRINRKHPDARRELEAIAPELFESVMSLKKLFR